MTNLKKLLPVTLLFALASLAIASSNGPTPVDNFDLERYVGKWNQLSAIPASFQDDCLGNTTAEYTILPKNLIKVENSCDKKNQKRKIGEARARVNKELNSDAALEVTFVKIFGWVWSFSGDYWVTYINDDYTVAIVGHPEYKFGWILARDASLSLNEYSNLNTELIRQGYDSCEFIMSNTPSQDFPADTRLCDLVAE